MARITRRFACRAIEVQNDRQPKTIFPPVLASARNRSGDRGHSQYSVNGVTGFRSRFANCNRVRRSHEGPEQGPSSFPAELYPRKKSKGPAFARPSLLTGMHLTAPGGTSLRRPDPLTPAVDPVACHYSRACTQWYGVNQMHGCRRCQCQAAATGLGRMESLQI